MFDKETGPGEGSELLVRRDFTSLLYGAPERKFAVGTAVHSRNFSMVLDFFCHGQSMAIYEGLMNCFVQQIVLLIPFLKSKENLASVAVVSGPQLKYMNILCTFLEPLGAEITFFLLFSRPGQIEHDNLHCLASRHVSNTGLVLDRGYLPWFRYDLEADPALLKDTRIEQQSTRSYFRRKLLTINLMHRSLGIACEPCSKILLLARVNTRAILDQPDLLAALGAHFGPGSVEVFAGGEGFTETAAKFARACAIVAVHGAGLANVLLSCRDTLVPSPQTRNHLPVHPSLPDAFKF
jgi:hypothetical protein